MRKPLLAGNWKMNMTLPEARALAASLVAGWRDDGSREVLVCPPAVCLPAVVAALRGSGIRTGAQNVHAAASGAYTGEISVGMVASAGASHVILGHSERRAIFGEDDAAINRKMKAVLAAQLVPVFCVGEVLAERKAGRAEAVVAAQVRGGLAGIGISDVLGTVIAYEPVWAIGTGETATPEQADAMHALIRRELTGLYGEHAACSVRILYGGSVNEKNVDALMACPNIDGALVGGASLKPDSFLRIVNFCQGSV